MPLPFGLQVLCDGEEAGVLALGPAVGLEGDAVVSGDVAEPVAELSDDGLVPLGLLQGDEGVEVRELLLAQGLPIDPVQGLDLASVCG